MLATITNRFTLFLATAGMLVALFAIAGGQGNTVSARTIVIPESSDASTTATSEVPEVRIEYIGGRVRSITEGISISPRVALTGDSVGGLEQDLVVNFAIKDGATASGSDYSYPSSVTIPAGATSAPFTLSATADDLIEYNETFNIYISSLEYNGANYDAEHAGVEFTIKSTDRIWRTIEKLPSSSWIEGGTADIRVRLTDRLPSDVPANSLFLTIGDGYDDIDITEQLKSSTEVDLSIPLNDNSLRATNEQLRVGLQFQKSQIPFLSRGGVVRINVADDEEPPQVVVRRNSRGRTSTISEGGRVQLTALAPNIAPVDLVVSLAAGMSTTLASSDYDFPASVTIPKGQRLVRFWVDTSDDDLAEYADILNIRPTSVVYGSHTHPLYDSGVDLTVNSSDRIGAAVDILGPDRLNEGDTVYIRITVDELLPPETPDGSIYLVLGRRNQASGNSIRADQDDTAGLPVNIVAALKVATSTVVPVELTDDSLIELNERVFVTLEYDREQVPFFRGRVRGRFIVLDNDQTSFSIAPLSRVVYRENEAIELTVELPDGVTSTLDIQIRYRIKLRLRDADGRRVNTVNRDDIAGFLTGTVIIPAGETSAMFRIELTEDQLVEETELLGIRLQRPRVIREDGRTWGLRNAVTSEITVVSVIDNDRPTIRIRPLSGAAGEVEVSLSDLSVVTEGDSIRLVAEITNAPNGAAVAIALNLGANTAGTTAYADDYEFPATVTIPTGAVRAVFTVNTFDDNVVEGDETLNIYIAGVTYGTDSYDPSDAGFDLTILDNDTSTSPAAKLSASSLTLEEGRVATIQVDLSGDLSSLVDGDTSVLTINARPVEGEETGLIRGTSDIYLPAEQNDYELTPVTIDKQAGQATFEIRAVDDSDYDPLESVLLELVSRSDDVQVVSPNSLKLKIGDNDPRPFVSFSSTIGNQRLNWEYENVGVQVSSVLEGDKRDYRIVLDRKSNRDTEFVVYLGGGDTPLLLREDGETPFPHSTYWSGPKYQDGEGYWSWSVREEWERVIIPAGELGLTFTVDTTSLENDLYDYYWDRALAVMFIYVYKDHYAYTDEIGSKHYFFLTQDEPAPQLLFKNSANDGDGDASITVSEGESFDVWVDISHQLGTLVIFDEPGLNLKARLTATTVSGAELNLDLPDVLIGAYQSGVTITVQIPYDSLSNGERTVALGFGDVVQLRRGPGVAFGKGVSARVGNRLIVTIVDDDDDEPPVVVPPATEVTITATLERSLFTLNEGRATTFRIDLDGDLSSLIDGDTTTLAIKDTPFRGGERSQSYEGYSYNYLAADRNDYELTPVTINKQTRQATFGVRAIDEDEFDPLESVRLEVVSRSDDIRVVATNSLRLNIFGNDRRPFISFTTTLTTVRNIDGANTVKIAEGDKGTFGVVLDRKSNRSVEVHIYSNGDFRPFFDENGVDPIRYARTHIGRRYFEDMGFWPGHRSWDDVIGPGPLVIPAGELGLTFTVDTTLLENDLYDYIDEDYFGTVYLKMNHPVYAYTDEASSRVHFRVLQDEPTPELSFRSADDGDATITVREGESFEVGIDIDPELGRYHRVWNSLLPGISLASQLTATAVTGDVPAWELPEIEIVPGQPGVTVMVQVPADSLSNGERTVVLDFEDALLSYTRSHLTAPPRIKNSLIVTILDADPPVEETITATLSTSSLTLEEGRVATITVDLGGDLSSLVNGDDTILTIEARPVEDEETGLIRGTSDIYLPAEQNDYELTPVTIDKQAGQATFEVRAVEDSDYDPLESVMLELVSHSDDVEIVSPNSLKLKIENNDPRPFVSFSSTIGTQRLLGEYATTDIPGSSVPEGEQRDFRVVLDRKSNRDVEFFIGFSGRPHLFSNDNEELVLPSSYIWTHGYLTEQGYRPGNPLNEWSLLRIPAGELGTTFTVDTRSAENDLYDYYWDRTISFGHIYVDKDHYAYTDHIGAKHNFFIAQDEPAPKLLLKSSAADDDGDATVTVSEGESFDVWVEVSHQFGTSVLFNEPDMNLKARLIATAITGAIPNLDLPDVYIGAYQSGVTITVQIPYDSLSNGERTVALGFGDVVQLRRGTSNAFGKEISARVGNRLIVTIVDDDTSTSPAAKLSASSLTLEEGRVATITVDLSGDLSSLVDGDTSVLTIEARPVEGEETGLIRGTSDIYLPAEQNDYELTPVTIDKQASQATFEIRAVDDSDYDPLESVMLELVSHSDDIEIVSPDSLKLKIGDNDPRPFVSFSSTIGTQRLLGEYATTDIPGSSVPEGEQRDFRVVLDRKSNRDVEFFIGFSGRPHLFSNDNEELVLPSDYIWTHGYLTEQGYRPGNPLNEWSLLRIPAGELGTTFTVDTRSAENDLYDYYWDRTISFGHIYVDKDHYAYTDHIGAKHNFFIAQDEPAPKLLLKSSAADDDGDATVTVSEGESFDVWVEVSHQFGTSVLFNEPDMNLKARLIATAITGAIPNLDLPDVYIGAYQSGVTITVQIPYDSLSNGERTVALGFGDVVQLRRGTSNAFGKEISARVGNRLIVTIVDDDEPPVVTIRSLSGVEVPDLSEGDTVQLVAELTNAPEGGATEDITVNLATQSGATASESDYSYPRSVTIPQGQSRVIFEVSASQDDLVEDDETLNIYASSVDFAGYNYEQSDTGADLTIVDVDFNDPPVVSVRRHRANFGVGEGGAASLIVELINAPEGGAAEDITVHLATGSGTTASESDYNYPSSVTIPRGQSQVEFEIHLIEDNLAEYDQRLNIYASSADYGGQNYEQSDSGADFLIVDDDEIDISITTLGGANQPERSTVTVRVELDQALPAGTLRANLINLSFSLSGTVDVDGLPFVVDITEALTHSTTVDVPFYVTGDYLSDEPGLVELRVSYANREGRLLPYEDVLDRAISEEDSLPNGEDLALEYQLPWLLPEPDDPYFFRIVDRDVPPIVSLKVRPSGGPRLSRDTRIDGLADHADIYENGSPHRVSLVAELINAPEGGAAQDITVHLGIGGESTASESDYTLSRNTITIHAGRVWSSRGIRVSSDKLVEYSETLNLYVSSVDYFGENYEQSDSGVDLTIHNREYVEPPIESVITVLDGVDQQEGTTVTVRVELSRVTQLVSVPVIKKLPERTPENSIDLVFSMGGSVHTVDITEALRDSSYVDVPFYLTDDHLLEQTERVDLRVRATYGPLIPLLSESQSFFRIIDNDEPPIVSIRSLSVAEGGVEVPDLNEGDTVQLVAELTNAPEGGAPQDITVNLATVSSSAVSGSDYSYPSSVTIPQGASQVTFEVSALQDDLVEDDETLNIYVSSVDFNSQNYEQSDTGVDLTIVDVDFNDPPVVSVRRFGHNFSVNEGGVAGLIAELIPAPQGGADRDITVHLASGSWSTASANDYSYPSSVTIPRGQSLVRFDVQALNDDLPEYPETFNVHVSSVDYAGRNYVQTRGGVDLTIISDDRIEPVITVLGGTDHLEGSTVTVRIAVSQVLPAEIPVNAITLSVLLSDSVRSVSVDGRSLGSEQSRVLYLVNALKASTSVDVVFSLTDDYIASPDGLVLLNFDTYNSLLLSGAQSSFRIVDNDEPPVVVVPDPIVTVRSGTSTSLTSTSSVRRSDLNSVNEGDTVQLVAELTNAPEGGATEDITVFLAARAGGTAKPEDIDFPASVTIAAGDSSVRFPVSATADSLVEYDEKINIYAASVEYGDSSLTLSDSGYDLTITSADRITARIAVLPSSDLVEGGTVTIRIVLSSPLPARTPVESLYLVPGSGYADIDITEGLRSSPVLDVEIPLQDDSEVSPNAPLTAELRFDAEQIPFLDGASVSFEVADNDIPAVIPTSGT